VPILEVILFGAVTVSKDLVWHKVMAVYADAALGRGVGRFVRRKTGTRGGAEDPIEYFRSPSLAYRRIG
jgi:hypothetical protein